LDQAVKGAILFDLDGTLIDSTEAILECFASSFHTFGLKAPPKQEILALIGHPLDFMFAHLGIEGDVQPFVDAYKRCYKKISKQKTLLLPGAKEAVEAANSFAKLAVVTTKTGLYSKELLEHLGLLHYFEVVIGREDVINPKPHPEPILKALHFIGAHPQNSWMIGDTCLDMDAAKKAGVGGVAVLCGYGSAEALRRCAQHVKRDAKEAVSLVSRFLNR
jgi:phosphoglycolate phosphatase